MTDTYDFAWNKYNNLAGDFANNYAFGVQTLGLIKPYYIEIKARS